MSGEKSHSPGTLQWNGRVQVDLASSPRADLRMPPVIHLATHGFKASLNPVNTHFQRVNQVEALRMLGQNRRKVSRERHVRTFGFRPDPHSPTTGFPDHLV